MVAAPPSSEPVFPPLQSVALPEEREPRGTVWKIAIPAWLVSLMIHVAILLSAAAYSIEPIRDAIGSLVINSNPSENNEEDDAFEVSSEVVAADLAASAQMPTEAVPQIDQISTDLPLDVAVPLEVGLTADMIAQSLSSQLAPGDIMAATGISAIGQGLDSRGQAMREDMLKKYGGSDATEKAVAMGLKWLAAHQLPDGRWSFVHSKACKGQCSEAATEFLYADNAATGLAVLCFLGAGQTHIEGDYKETVFKALGFLLQNMKIDKVGKVAVGSWFHETAPKGTPDTFRMYGHAIATTAMCEAFGMTKDPKLAEAAQLGINFIVASQDPRGGGWWYKPLQPGDTSVVGWQLMALKSGYMSGMVFPQETIRRASRFLDYVQTDNGAHYGYRQPGDRKKNDMGTTAAAVLCRMYMGTPKDHPGLLAAIDALSTLEEKERKDAYVMYYATQALKQYGGDRWDSWNKKMQDFLVGSQINTGHAAGSWEPKSFNFHHGKQAGRHYHTCMAIMVLEVYYRYLPIYGEQKEEDQFEL